MSRFLRKKETKVRLGKLIRKDFLHFSCLRIFIFKFTVCFCLNKVKFRIKKDFYYSLISGITGSRQSREVKLFLRFV